MASSSVGAKPAKGLGIVHLTDQELHELSPASGDSEHGSLKRPGLIWFDLAMTPVLLIFLIFGGMWIIPKVSSAILFEIGFAIALLVNYR